ncbi:uncharacterized protein N7496_003815 [Penicillium cataractarum]|uniref:Uncharacterized protein n=1 Tax=Penicillium cataractarum TaxID=2100454 RepID=A0A9W9VGR5_9EURO|nr:uncharacterized protein N7496_003815 [Penicillium cataractarum]KAJ5381387.1 hypothetical protein N7496_003815 [Penicillium cataractarum]
MPAFAQCVITIQSFGSTQGSRHCKIASAQAGWLHKVPSVCGGGPTLQSTGGGAVTVPAKRGRKHETAKRGPPFTTTATSSFNVQMVHIRCQMVVQRGTMCTFCSLIRPLAR